MEGENVMGTFVEKQTIADVISYFKTKEYGRGKSI